MNCYFPTKVGMIESTTKKSSQIIGLFGVVTKDRKFVGCKIPGRSGWLLNITWKKVSIKDTSLRVEFADSLPNQRCWYIACMYLHVFAYLFLRIHTDTIYSRDHLPIRPESRDFHGDDLKKIGRVLRLKSLLVIKFKTWEPTKIWNSTQQKADKGILILSLFGKSWRLAWCFFSLFYKSSLSQMFNGPRSWEEMWLKHDAFTVVSIYRYNYDNKYLLCFWYLIGVLILCTYTYMYTVYTYTCLYIYMI